MSVLTCSWLEMFLMPKRNLVVLAGQGCAMPPWDPEDPIAVIIRLCLRLAKAKRRWDRHSK